MDYFRATNDKQLGLCLRMLYAEGIQGFVEVVKNNKNKIEFQIRIEDSQKFDLLRERYEILIS